MKLIRIDGEKLVEIIKSKGLTGSEVSRYLGYSEGYVSKAKRRNQVSQMFVNLLEHDYDISYDEYKPAEKTDMRNLIEEMQEETAESTTERPETQEVTLSQKSIDEILRAIKNGVYVAVCALRNNKVI